MILVLVRCADKNAGGERVLVSPPLIVQGGLRRVLHSIIRLVVVLVVARLRSCVRGG